MSTPTFIYVEGSVAAGKTELLTQLSDRFPQKVHVEFEPLEIWQNYRNKYNLLQLLYSNAKEFALKFQIIAQVTQSNRESRAQLTVKDFVFFERSIRTQQIFIETLFNTGDISELDYFILEDLYKLTKDEIKNYKIIYLRTSPETCLHRVKQRGRLEEKKVSQSYLEMLHIAHDKWLLGLENCLVLDGNLPTSELVNIISAEFDLDSCTA